MYVMLISFCISYLHTLDVLDAALCDKVCRWLPTGRWLSLSTPVSFTNKTDCHETTETLLKVALNTIIVNSYLYYIVLLNIDLFLSYLFVHFSYGVISWNANDFICWYNYTSANGLWVPEGMILPVVKLMFRHWHDFVDLFIFEICSSYVMHWLKLQAIYFSHS